MNRLGAPARGVQILRRRERACGVVSEQGRDFQRNPAVDAVGPLVDRAEQVGGARQIVERQLKEQLLAATALPACSRMSAS